MKIRFDVLSLSLLLSAAGAPRAECDSSIRQNIGQEIPLADAVRDFNLNCSDNNPLTEEEVIAAIRAIKTGDHEMPQSLYEIYQQVDKRRVLPRGMGFTKVDVLISGNYLFDIDWKFLAFIAPPYDGRESVTDPSFKLPIRKRFISSRELSHDERALREAVTPKSRDTEFVIRVHIRSEGGVLNDAWLHRNSQATVYSATDPYGDAPNRRWSTIPTSKFAYLWNTLENMTALRRFITRPQPGVGWYSSHVRIEATTNGSDWSDSTTYKIPMEQIPHELMEWLKEVFDPEALSER